MLMAADFNLSLPGGERWTLEIRPVINAPALSVAVVSLLMSLLVFGLEPALQVTRSLDVRSALAAGAGVGGIQDRPPANVDPVASGDFGRLFRHRNDVWQVHDRGSTPPSGHRSRADGVAVLNLQSAKWDETRVQGAIDRLPRRGTSRGGRQALAVSTSLRSASQTSRLPVVIPGMTGDNGPVVVPSGPSG